MISYAERTLQCEALQKQTWIMSSDLVEVPCIYIIWESYLFICVFDDSWVIPWKFSAVFKKWDSVNILNTGSWWLPSHAGKWWLSLCVCTHGCVHCVSQRLQQNSHQQLFSLKKQLFWPLAFWLKNSWLTFLFNWLFGLFWVLWGWFLIRCYVYSG